MLIYVLLITGIILLVKGADWLVDGASALAKKLGVSTLVVGLTVIALGTSMPELVVNIVSALNGAPEVAFGNVLGSNIANIFLILGVAALIIPIRLKRPTIWREIPFSLLAVLVLLVVANDLIIDRLGVPQLSRIDGLVMTGFLLIFLYYVYELAKSKSAVRPKIGPLDDGSPSNKMITLTIVGGMAGLYFGGLWTVGSAIDIASKMGLSQFLISATIVALGTSLPELVTAIAAARKKQADMIVGNVVGSNIFNIFFVLAAASLVAPIRVPDFINQDMLFLLGATLLLFIALFVGKKRILEKWQGWVFLALYLFYLVFVVWRG